MCSVRVADGPVALQGWFGGASADAARDAATALAAEGPSRGAARPGGHLPEVPGEGYGQALPRLPGARRRSEALAGRGTGQGAAGGADRAAVEVDAAQPGPGHGGRPGTPDGDGGVRADRWL